MEDIILSSELSRRVIVGQARRASKQIPRELRRFKMLYVDNCVASPMALARLGPVT